MSGLVSVGDRVFIGSVCLFSNLILQGIPQVIADPGLLWSAFLRMLCSRFSSQSSSEAQHLRETLPPFSLVTTGFLRGGASSIWLQVTYFLGVSLAHGKHILVRRSELSLPFHSPFILTIVTSLFLLYRNREKHSKCSVYTYNSGVQDLLLPSWYCHLYKQLSLPSPPGSTLMSCPQVLRILFRVLVVLRMNHSLCLQNLLYC